MNSSKPVPVHHAVHEHRDALSPAEAKAAKTVLEDLESVAFGTVAQVAARAGVSGPTVVRLANRLGYDGFVGLQAAARDEVRGRLRAGETVRTPATEPLVATLESSMEALQSTFDRLDRKAFDKVVQLLVDDERAIFVLGSERMRATTGTLYGLLAVLRDGVHLLDGNEYRIATALRAVERGDVVIILDSTPAESWVEPMAARAAERRAAVVAILADGPHPAARHARHILTAAVRTGGLFHTQVAALAVVEALCFDVGRRRPNESGKRLHDLVDWWMGQGLLDPN